MILKNDIIGTGLQVVLTVEGDVLSIYAALNASIAETTKEVVTADHFVIALL